MTKPDNIIEFSSEHYGNVLLVRRSITQGETMKHGKLLRYYKGQLVYHWYPFRNPTVKWIDQATWCYNQENGNGGNFRKGQIVWLNKDYFTPVNSLAEKLVFKGNDRYNYRWAVFEYRGYEMAFQLTLMGSTRLHLWKIPDGKMLFFHAIVCNICTGTNYELLERIAKAVLGCIDRNELQKVPLRADINPAFNDELFMQWLSGMELQHKPFDIPVLSFVIERFVNYEERLYKKMLREFINRAD